MVMSALVAPSSALPGISLTGGEIGWALPLALPSLFGTNLSRKSISPLVGEMSGRTEGGNPPATRGAFNQ